MTDGYELLRRVVESLTPLDDDACADFRSCWHLATLERGAYFAEEGQRPYRFGFVITGVLRAFYRTQDGVEYNKTFFTEGTFAGPLAALVRGTTTYINLQALEDTHLLTVDYRTLTALYDRHRSLERFARRAIEEEWVKKEERELRLVLCRVEERYDYFQQKHPGLENRIPQYHIASYLGITPVALSRIRRRRAEGAARPPRQIPS